MELMQFLSTTCIVSGKLFNSRNAEFLKKYLPFDDLDPIVSIRH